MELIVFFIRKEGRILLKIVNITFLAYNKTKLETISKRNYSPVCFLIISSAMLLGASS